MTYRYYVQFITQYDPDLIPTDAVSFQSELKVGDVIQLEDGGEYHLVRLITHSPSGLTIHLSGKGQDIPDLLMSEPEFVFHTKIEGFVWVDPLDVIIKWQELTR